MLLRFAHKTPQSGGAVSFTFTPAEPLVWTAGQSIKIEVPGPYGPLEHRFTISSAPYEGLVTITTRLSGSPYKNSLDALKTGEDVNAYSIEGDFTWRDAPKPHVFIASGIGITPYHSMLKQRAHEGKTLAATLIYGSSTEPIFKNELDELASAYPEFAAHYKVGRIRVDDIPATTGLIYLSGPSAMVDELAAALIARGIPQQQLVRDWFTGKLST